MTSGTRAQKSLSRPVWLACSAIAVFAAGWLARGWLETARERAGQEPGSRTAQVSGPGGAVAGNVGPASGGGRTSGHPAPQSAGKDAVATTLPELLRALVAASESDTFGRDVMESARLLGSLSLEDAERLWQDVLDQDGETYELARDGLMTRIIELDPQRAIALALAGSPEDPDGDVLGPAFFELARRDSAAALTALAKLPADSEGHRAAYTGYLLSVSESDPAHALTLAAETTFPDEAEEAVYSRWLTRDPAAALARASQEETETAKSAASAAMDQWLQRDADAAWAWIGSLPAEQQFTHVRNALRHEADRDPKSAAERLLAMPLALTGGDDGATKIAFNVAKEFADESDDPAAWLARFPAETDRAPLYGGVAAGLAREDPVAASEWIATVPKGPLFDAAAESLVFEMGSNDPERALEWAGAIGDTAKSDAATARVYRRWMSTDPRAAQTSLDQLPAERQATILEKMKARSR